jgi:MFS transporter, PAT family, beta-lactamase induction signal transducer AmpG
VKAESPARPTAVNALRAIGTDYRLAALLLLGMGPGLSITISGGTIAFWLAENGFSPSRIGFLALAMLPFVFKFVWAPLLEGAFEPLRRVLGRRKSWLLPLNALTIASIAYMATLDPSAGGLAPIAIAGFLFSLFASSQEVVSEGLRIDRTRERHMAVGVTLASIGARIGMLVGSAGALLIAARAGWSAALLTMACFMALVSVGAIILRDADESDGTHSDSRTGDSVGRRDLFNRLVGPFREFFTREGAWLVFGFMLLVRLGDSMAGSMFPSFAVAAKFTKEQVAFANSMVGFVGVAVGSIIGVFVYRALSERAGLLLAVLAVGVSNIGYVILTHHPGDARVLALAMGVENLAGGFGAVMMLSYMSRLCDVRFTATQFALLTAAAACTRLVAAGPSGKLVEALGFESFFTLTIFASLPVLALLALMMRRGLVSAARPSPGRINRAAFE